jgi:hypothetical protein
VPRDHTRQIHGVQVIKRFLRFGLTSRPCDGWAHDLFVK